MATKKQVIVEDMLLGKLVHGGQALAVDDAGKKLFVWGGLPGERVNVRITKKRSSFREGIVDEVLKPSPDRIAAVEPLSYLSTSPWQIMAFDAENMAKQTILEEAFEREGLSDITWQPFVPGAQEYEYRNKQEFGFWGDDDGLHLAHYVRGTHGKQMVQGSILTTDAVNRAARWVRDELNRLSVWGGDLKTVVVRSSVSGQVVAALFVKTKEIDFATFRLGSLQGIDIYYSDPKSPASPPTELIVSLGDTILVDSVNDVDISYGVLSFFQVNVGVFEQALDSIAAATKGIDTVDFYSGVGTIGIAVGASTLVESEAANTTMATINVGDKDIAVVHAASEHALDYVLAAAALIVDPPRAGLHKTVIERVLSVLPPKVVYLSCNPSTQARDVSLLSSAYRITDARGYNFFPRTPHIESLVVLERYGPNDETS